MKETTNTPVKGKDEDIRVSSKPLSVGPDQSLTTDYQLYTVIKSGFVIYSKQWAGYYLKYLISCVIHISRFINS